MEQPDELPDEEEQQSLKRRYQEQVQCRKPHVFSGTPEELAVTIKEYKRVMLTWGSLL